MSLLSQINRLSYPQIISISIFLMLLFGIPTTVLLAQQRTEIASRAYQKPVASTSPKTEFGPIPNVPPQIGRVFPWVGKIGDIIFIQGQHFGTNPPDKSLTIGDVAVPEANIAAWEDNLIQAIIPQGAAQGGTVQVRVGPHPPSESLPFVLYDHTTTLKLKKRGNLILASPPHPIVKIKVWTGDENHPTQYFDTPITPQPGGDTLLFDTKGQPLLTFLIYDSAGHLLPYYVDPIEFDF